MGLIDDFLNDPTGRSRREKHTVFHDMWDTSDYENLLEEMDMLESSRKDLADFTETGSHAFGDFFFELVKAHPRLNDPADIQANYLVNRFVMREASGLDEYEAMRAYTTGDHVAAALASVDMEPDLEEIFDRLRKQQEKAQALQDAMDALAAAMEGDGDGDGSGEGQAAPGEGDQPGEAEGASNYQDQQELIEQARQAVLDAAEALEESLEGAGQEVRGQLQQALNKAIEEAGTREDACQMWGLAPGQAHRLPASKRIELAKKVNNDRMRRIAKLFGPMHRMAFAEQRRRTVYARDEVHSVEMGSDLSRILPLEILRMRHPLMRLDFIRRLYEGNLQQWHLRGEEALAKGGIIYCEDGSGSMSGDREIWAKAVGLCLLQIAAKQKRPYYGIHFGSPGEFRAYDFDTGRLDPEMVLEFAELHFGGGTDFVTPLNVALERLQEEHATKGAIKADIVFATDGMCGVPEDWLAKFKEEQKRLDFKCYGISIGGHAEDEPLNTICDGRVLTVQKLTSGDDVRRVFGGV